MKIVIIIFFALFSCTPRTLTLPNVKKLEVTGNYTHFSSGVSFPQMIDNLKRKEIILYEKHLKNLSASYIYHAENIEYMATIYLYKAGLPHDNRLSNEYYSVLESMATVSEDNLVIDQTIKYFEDLDIRNIGLEAIINNYIGYDTSKFLLFQCGEWFLKIRISTKNGTKNQINSYEKSFLKSFNPVKIAQRNAVTQKMNIKIREEAFVDSLTLNSFIAGAYTKVIWLKNNVDSLEKNAGIPSVYLEQHKAEIDSMLGFWNKHKEWKSNNRFFQDLITISKNGFIEEMLIDSFDGLLIYNGDKSLELPKYKKWKMREIPNFRYKVYYYIHYSD